MKYRPTTELSRIVPRGEGSNRAPCRFLENFSLASLLAPVRVSEFRDRYWEQRPLVVHRRNRDFYDDLFSLADFDEAIAHEPDYIKINDAGVGTTEHRPDSRGLDSVLAKMRDGG